MTRLLVLGAGGMTGWEVAQRAAARGFDAVALTRDQLDIGDASAVENVIRNERPDAIVNAAAYTAVDKAESEPELAMRINADGARNVARAAASAGSVLVHISTDYVFDGMQRSPYTPDAPVNPTGAYGKSKLAGEEAVAGELERHAIIRTSWVFSHRGRNFVRTMLAKAAQGAKLRVVNDQQGSPTAAADLAEAALSVATAMHGNLGMGGTWHFTNSGVTTWFDFAREIFDLAKIPADVVPIPTSEFPTAATRPAYSALDTSSFGRDFGIEPRPWRDALRETLEKLI